MTKAFAPRQPRGSWWMALPIALGLLGSAVFPSRGQDPTPKADTPATKAKDEPKPPAAPVEPARGAERWEDPRAAEALASTFEIVAVPLNPEVRRTVLELAEGRGQLAPAAIDSYVKSLASELTRKANIKSLVDLGGNADKAKDIERAAADLLKPLSFPASGANQRFRQLYVAKLIEIFKPIWKGNLHSRTMAMIVLSRTADPQALPVFTAQLNDPEQLAIVKLLTAVGITNAADNGRTTLEGQDPVLAARALSGFLERESDTFWPAQFRALEALGSLRLATPLPQNGKAEFASTALLFLADPNAKPAVRVWAAWALGMMQIPGSVQNYNFSLIAYVAGQAAVDLGNSLVAISDQDLSNRGQRLADQLVQLNMAFSGDPDIRNSGLTHAGNQAAGAAQGYVGEVYRLVKGLTKSALDLGAAVGVQIPARRKALVASIDELKGFLVKPPAGGFTLHTGASPIEMPAPKVAGGAKP